MAENVFDEIMVENFPYLKKETDIWIQEVQKVPNRVNPKRPTPKHITTVTQREQKVTQRELP